MGRGDAEPSALMPSRNVVALSAVISSNAARAAPRRASTAIRTGENLSASRPASGAETRAPTENKLAAAAATPAPQLRDRAA